MKILLITDSTDASIGMRLAGVETVVVRNAQSAEAALKKAVLADDIALLMITDGVDKLCGEQINEVKKQGRPLIVTVPDSDKGFASSGAVSEYVKNAIGINI
ncbi:MAG: V-type ATP synthase subunit F [Clostridia bacterium]|nr:V-type ATP synthase subunit F [Clostridia bacterium]